MSKRIAIPGQGNREDAVIQRQLVQAAVQSAIDHGAPIPIHLVGAAESHVPAGPPHPLVEETAEGPRFVPLMRAATLVPLFHGSAFSADEGAEPESEKTHIYLPAFVRLPTGAFVPADTAGLRAFIPTVRRLKYVEKLEGGIRTTEYAAQVRSELTLTYLGPMRVAEIMSVRTQPWMCLTTADLPSFEGYVQKVISARESNLLDPDHLQNQGFVEALMEQWLDEARKQACEEGGCELGLVENPDQPGNKAYCGSPKCHLRGCLAQYGPGQGSESSSTEKSAETGPDEAEGGSGEPSEPLRESSSD